MMGFCLILEQKYHCTVLIQIQWQGVRTGGGRINKPVPYLGPVLVCRQSRASRNCRSAAFAHVDGPSVQSIQPIQSIQPSSWGLAALDGEKEGK